MLTLKSIVILAVLVLQAPHGKACTTCSFKWSSNLPYHFPLIWKNSQVVYPSLVQGNWSIDIASDSTINVGCGNARNFLKNYLLPEAVITCDRSGNLKTESLLTTSFEQLGCQSDVKENLFKGGTCYKGYTNVNISFTSLTTRFPLIHICHNEDTAETVMAQHFIQGASYNPFEISNDRPSFKEGSFYPTISADSSYKQTSQIERLTELLGSQELAEKYIDSSQSFYLARGHLAPDGDFVHIYEQDATYYFINVVPQWQSINNGNWKMLETALRNYASTKDVKLTVWTGGKGVLKLQDVNNNPVEIYLAKDSSSNNMLPVPEITWKVVHDAEHNAAVAVFIVNNPHLTEVPNDLKPCTSICSKVSWVDWDTSDITKGYTICCRLTYSVKSYLRMVPDVGEVILMS